MTTALGSFFSLITYTSCFTESMYYITIFHNHPYRKCFSPFQATQLIRTSETKIGSAHVFCEELETSEDQKTPHIEFAKYIYF